MLAQQNAAGEFSVSKGNASIQKGIVLGNVLGFGTSTTGEWMDVSGLPHISVNAQGTTDGNAPDYPDSTVGMVLVTIEASSHNASEFEAGAGVSSQRLGQFLVPLTDDPNFEVPAVFRQFQNVNAKAVRYIVTMINVPSLPANSYAKLILRLSASA